MWTIGGVGGAETLMSAQAAWPVESNILGKAASEDGSSLDREALGSLRETLAGRNSADTSAHSDPGRNAEATTAGAPARMNSITDGAASSRVQQSAAARPSPGFSVGGRQNPPPAQYNSSSAYQSRAKQQGAKQQAASRPEERDGAQGAEWQLSSISRKDLRSGRSRSSSLVRPASQHCCGRR